ncbi:MAG: CAP domain-containing protein [Moorea sp. SIO2I5]|nr:CAP domain-containing protein [Moorena sp. SIO2I5]
MSDRAKAAGYLYSYVGENIAAGNPTPAQTIRQWMGSTGHRRNILKPQYQEIGFGYVSDPSSPYRHYWVQVFGSPR